VRWVDFAGYGASLLVFMTFYMKDMIKLRSLALCSNVAFLFYAFPSHLFPILALHGALIPINICRLLVACRDQAAPGSFDLNAARSAGREAKPLRRRFYLLRTNLFSALKHAFDHDRLHRQTGFGTRKRAELVAWTHYSRALICVIGALVITIGVLAVITTAPAARREFSFCEPVG
jgi:hypothetical protein